MIDLQIIWFVIALAVIFAAVFMLSRSVRNPLVRYVIPATAGIVEIGVFLSFLLGRWSNSVWAWIVVGGIGLLLLAYLIYFFAARLAGALQHVQNHYHQLVENPTDTDQAFSESSNPFVALGQDIHAVMIAAFGSFQSKISDAVSRLSTLVTELDATTNLQTSGMNDQLSAINQTTTTTKQLATTSNQSTEKAQMVVDSAQESMRVTSNGKGSVDETIEEMNQIKRRVERIAEEILDLSERTQQIGVIITTVNDIAEQTHMLALNAAIEASKAGESGRGFSVVAYEVRKLSEKSQEAALKIRELIGQIQDATNSTVMVTEEGSKRVDIGVEKIRRAGNFMEQSIKSLEENVNHAEQILIASKQQTIGIEQITLAMSNINDVIKQLVRSAYQTQEATESISTLAGELRDFFGRN